jgi:hypothetical protein
MFTKEEAINLHYAVQQEIEFVKKQIKKCRARGLTFISYELEAQLKVLRKMLRRAKVKGKTDIVTDPLNFEEQILEKHYEMVD